MESQRKLSIDDAMRLLRCSQRDRNSSHALCRGPAVAVRQAAGDPGLALVCAKCLREGDRPLPDVLPGILVRVVGEILLAGISEQPRVAEAEGVAHAAAAVVAAAGRFTLWRVRSQAVDFRPWPPPEAGGRGSGGRE